MFPHPRPVSVGRAHLHRTLLALVMVPALGAGVLSGGAGAALGQDTGDTSARGSLDSFRAGLAGPDGSVAGSVDGLGSLTPDALSQVLGSSGLPLFAGSTAIGLANFVGFTPDLFAGEPANLPDPDPSITTTEVLEIVPGPDGLEQWKIAYAPMQRVITVEVYRSRLSDNAPNLYLLDGVGSPQQSGFRAQNVPAMFADQDVNLIIPTQGVAAMWADWNEPDPELGMSKWETFLSQDLPRLLETGDTPLLSNGTTAIGGISMGASAAMTLAAKHPEMYDGAFGISGCYQTDGLGQILADYSVASRGGDITNMWGPVGGAQWQDNDATLLAENLRGKPIFFSSATGAAIDGELEQYDYDIIHFTLGAMLEQGVNSCSGSFSRRLDSLGIDHTWAQLPQGMHNWWNFREQIPVAWDAIKDEL